MDEKFHRFMVRIIEVYDKYYRSEIPIREVDGFMKKIVEVYKELGDIKE